MTSPAPSRPADAGLIEKLVSVVGVAHVVTDAQALAPYLAEPRGLFHGSTPALVCPGNTEETAAIVRLCVAAGVAIVPQGGNTGLVGGSAPDGAVLLNLERMNRIRALDPIGNTLIVEAGCVLATAQRAADAAQRLFPLSLGAEGSCQIGGNLSTNAGGLAVLRYGTMRDLTLGIEAVLPDGSVWNGLKALRKDNTGYDLKQLLIGGEGTLGVITAAVLKLFPAPAVTQTALIGLARPQDAIALLARARIASADTLVAFELISRRALDFALRHIAGTLDPLGAPHAWYVLAERHASAPGLESAFEDMLAGALGEGAIADAALAQSGAQRASFWKLREAIVSAQRFEGASIKNDVSVPVAAVPEFLARAEAAVAALCPGIRVVAFGHVGDGNIHFNLTQPEGVERQAYLDRWWELAGAVDEVVQALGGSFSAEHGIGRLKRRELARFKSPVELALMRRVKSAFDPLGLMNPGVFFDS
ncbi:MAG: FAD-binding oxidoreductase [Alphaproteobacteria bacterium]|nr:FAD-binding oxidoreductase [Alphaproteobacteria bacterium]